MHPRLPLTLARLQSATTVERETAWVDFVAAYSGLVLHTCRSVARDHDAVMDAYAYVLEALHADDCRRLRAYVPDDRTKFTTWLVVVVRRLVLDHLRQRYGRARSGDEQRREEHVARRRIEDLVAEEIEPDQLPSADGPADLALRREQLLAALRSAIEELDPSDRLLLVLRFIDERPVRDIARALRFPTVFHVYRRLAAVLAELRRSLARRHVEGSEP